LLWCPVPYCLGESLHVKSRRRVRG
jgi:hypothetical protein